jgi:hypothetical protein
VPDELASIPEHALLWGCDQLEAEPTELLAYGSRAQTRSDDLAAIRAQLGFGIASAQDLDRLGRWLVGRALEHDAQAPCARWRPSISWRGRSFARQSISWRG